MWSGLGMSHLLVTQQAAGQNVVQAAVLVPTAVIAQRQPFQLDELRQRVLEDRFERLDIGPSIGVDFVTRVA
ncbi:hypothetical protein D3C76_1649370 [compost metagenome]